MKLLTKLANSKRLYRTIKVLRFKVHLNNFKNEMSILHEIKYMRCEKQVLKAKKFYKIAFIIPDMVAFSGGETSILRLGTYLHELGHDVYYIPYKDLNKEKLEKNAEINLPNYKGSFMEKEALNTSKFDIGICTYWLSAYHLMAHQNNFDYKMYFIQDFEPYFYSVGDSYYLSLNTYKMGFHMVSLGEWNKKQIENLTTEKADYIDFPVEISEYNLENRKISIKDEIQIAVYIKTDEKRAPLFLIEQIVYLKKKLESIGYKVVLNIFGMDVSIKIDGVNNLGLLKGHELRELYKKSHFGLVASLTNISLINYEMLMSGLPVIDFWEGSAPTFFTENEMIFTKFDGNDMFNKVHYYLKHQKELNDMVKRGQKKILGERKTWEESSYKFNELIVKAVKNLKQQI